MFHIYLPLENIPQKLNNRFGPEKRNQHPMENVERLENKFIFIHNKQEKAEKPRHCSLDRNSKILHFASLVACLLPSLKHHRFCFLNAGRKMQ